MRRIDAARASMGRPSLHATRSAPPQDSHNLERINVDGLRTFLAVAQHGHLGHAAEALGAEQSTVSRKIARLEEEVGVALFERIRRSIRLTPAGNRLVPRAERLLHDL